MKQFMTVFLAVFAVALTTAMIVKSNQKWDSNANDLMRTLTPDVLTANCGQPAADMASANNRRMFYPTSKDKSIGLIFSFQHTPGEPGWTYLSSNLGSRKGKGLIQIEDVRESQSWALIELPCLDRNR